MPRLSDIRGGRPVTLNPYQAPGEAIDFAEVANPDGRTRELPPRTVEALRESRPWVSLLSGLGMFVAGIALLGWSFAIVQALSNGTKLQVILWTLPKLVTNVALFAAAVLLRRYANAIGDLLVSGHVDHLDVAIEAQKTFWRFSGITAAVVLILLCAIVLLFFIGGGMSAVL